MGLSRRWQKLAGPLLLVASGLISLLLLEVAIRVLMPEHDPAGRLVLYRNPDGVPLGKADSVSRHFKASGDFDVTVRINPHGLRDRKDLRDARPGDLFVVGDSFSFGHGVEEDERFSDLLASRLGEPVYNLAIGATDFDGYDKLLRYAGELGAPVHRLIVGVCVENDLKRYEDTGGQAGYDPPKPGLARKVKGFMKTRLALYSALTALIHRQPMLRRTAVRWRLIDVEYHSVHQAVYADPELSREVVASSVARLERLTAGLDRADVVVVVIASRGLWIGDSRQSNARVHESLVGRLRERGFRVVDLRPAFEASGDPLQFHFEVDGHWNRDGHARAAEEILAILK